MTAQESLPPFWPSPRLRMKFVLALVYIPVLVVLLAVVFMSFLFVSMDTVALHIAIFVLLLIGGPISVALMLNRSWRGLLTGILTGIVIPSIWPAAKLADRWTQSIGVVLEIGLVAAAAFVLLQAGTKDVRSRSEMLGLAIGISGGLLLVIVDGALIGPFPYGSPREFELFVVSLWTPTALVGSSAFFFPEFLSRRVSWGGLIVWAGTVTVLLVSSVVLVR